jgi:hypothetical protein
VANSPPNSSSVTEYAKGANGNVAPTVTISGASTGLSAPAGIALDTSHGVVVANRGNNTVTEYAPGVSGNAAPLTTISGVNTGLDDTDGIATAANPALVASNSFDNSITEYASGANGNETPVATIAGGNTMLNTPTGLAQNSAGDLFVASSRFLLEFAPGANGNVAPIASIFGSHTGLGLDLGGVALDSAGDVFVVNVGSTPDNGSVTEYAKGANGDATPIATIAGAHTGFNRPSGIVVDPSGNLFVTNRGNGTDRPGSVTEFAKGANGDATPIATIAGHNTGLRQPKDLAMDSSGTLFVTNFDGGSVTEFAKGANGDVAPTAMIQGPATGLSNGPAGVRLDSAGNLFVVNTFPNSVVEFPKGASGNATPTATITGPATGLNGPYSVAVAINR